jgi:hypothetical protein
MVYQVLGWGSLEGGFHFRLVILHLQHHISMLR